MQQILVRYAQPFRRLFAVSLTALLSTLPASAWWETGHRTVARLAVLHLTLSTRARIAHILDVPDTPEAVSNALAVASTWADETKAETKTGSWHYIDLAIQDTPADLAARCHDDDCVTLRIRSYAHPQSLDQLRYLVHLVGDLHQPLHAVSDADLGGNCEHVDPPLLTAQNLHAVWDGAIVNSLGLSDRDLAASLDQKWASFSQHEQDALTSGDEKDWTWESHERAIEVYRKLNIPIEPVVFPHSCGEAPPAVANLTLSLKSSYLEENQALVREQLLKAGVRLAKMLNDAYASERN